MRGFADLLAFLILYLFFGVWLEDCADRKKADAYNRKAEREGLQMKKVFDDCNKKSGEDKARYVDCLRDNGIKLKYKDTIK